MEKQKNRLPFVINMFCGFYFVYWALSILALIAALLMRIGSQFPALTDITNQINMIFLGTQISISWVTWLIAIGLVAGVIGYWLYQKWAVIVYAAATVALFIVSLPPTANAPTKTMYAAVILYTLATIFAINIAFIVVGIIYFKKMK